MWNLLAEQYGSQWTHGPEPSMGWIYALRDMTPDQLRQGVDNLVHREDNKWPPNAQEFADLCRTSFDWERQCHKPFNPPPQLVDMTAMEKNAEIGAQTLASLRSLFA